jgi:zinc protease
MRILTFFARALPLALSFCISAPALAALPIQKWQQASGAQVWFIEAQGLPIVDVQIDFDAGGRRDPAEKRGLAGVTASMHGKGVEARNGEPALDENELGEAWADVGAGFGADASSERMSFTLRSLTYPDLLAKAVPLAARQMGEPAFPDHVWQRDRQRMVAAIREANTRPATHAARAFNQAVYGSHPYGWENTEESLARLNVQDMRSFYQQMVRPCRAKASVVGAVSREQADQLVAQLLSRLPSGACGPLPPAPEVAPLQEAVERQIPFASAQAHVLIGQPGYKRLDPDYFPLLVGNYILGGGGFVSRLVEEVRHKRGLSYSVYSYFSPGLHAGAFTLGLQTRPDQAAQAVQVSRDVVKRFIAEGPTAAELKAAKDFMVGGFALRLDSNRKLLDNLSGIAWYDLPLDYLDTWTRQVEKVTAAEIKAAFARKLQPDRMVTVVVGGDGAVARQ